MTDSKDNDQLLSERMSGSHLSRAIANILEPARAALKAESGEKRNSIAESSSRIANNQGTKENVVKLSRSSQDLSTKDDESVQKIPVDKIEFSPYQAREIESDQELEGLVVSVREKGILQPIIVRSLSNNGERFELIAGERRLRAARVVGLEDICAVVVDDCSDVEAAELGLIENLQRENLNPVEEALGYQNLCERFKITQKDVANLVGRSRAAITNSLRLLQLHPDVIEMIKSGELSAGHGKVLCALEDQKAQLRIAKRIIKSEMSVRALESILSKAKEEPVELSDEEEKELAQIQRLEGKIQTMLDLETAKLSLDPQGRRRLLLTFETEASWKRFVAKIK